MPIRNICLVVRYTGVALIIGCIDILLRHQHFDVSRSKPMRVVCYSLRPTSEQVTRYENVNKRVVCVCSSRSTPDAV